MRLGSVVSLLTQLLRVIVIGALIGASFAFYTYWGRRIGREWIAVCVGIAGALAVVLLTTLFGLSAPGFFGLLWAAMGSIFMLWLYSLRANYSDYEEEIEAEDSMLVHAQSAAREAVAAAQAAQMQHEALRSSTVRQSADIFLQHLCQYGSRPCQGSGRCPAK